MNAMLPKQHEAQLMLRNPRDAFRGQSRSLNMAPFDILSIVFSLSYKTHRFRDIRRATIQWPWNPG